MHHSFHRVRYLMSPLKGGVGIDFQHDVGKGSRSGPPHPDLATGCHSFDLLNVASDLLGQPLGCCVHEYRNGSSAELQAHVDHDHGDREGGHSVSVGQSWRPAKPFGQPHNRQPGDHDGRAPDIGTEMQGIGFQRLAIMLLSCSL